MNVERTKNFKIFNIDFSLKQKLKKYIDFVPYSLAVIRICIKVMYLGLDAASKTCLGGGISLSFDASLKPEN